MATVSFDSKFELQKEYVDNFFDALDKMPKMPRIPDMVLCQDLKQIKMRIFHRKINICSLSCIYTII